MKRAMGGGRTARCSTPNLHIIDLRFPLVPNRGYLPEPFAVADYLERTKPLNVVSGAVVFGSFQVFDQGYLLDAVKGHRSTWRNRAGVLRWPPTSPR